MITNEAPVLAQPSASTGCKNYLDTDAHPAPTKLDKIASRQPTLHTGAPSASPTSVPAFSPMARRLPLLRAKLTDIFYIPSVLRPNSPPIIVKSNAPDSSRLSWRGTPLPHQSSAAPPCTKSPSRSIAPRFRCRFRQSRILSLLLISLLYPTRKGRAVDSGHGGKPCLTHSRAIISRGYFLPLGKRCAHSSQAVLFENFPC